MDVREFPIQSILFNKALLLLCSIWNEFICMAINLMMVWKLIDFANNYIQFLLL